MNLSIPVKKTISSILVLSTLTVSISPIIPQKAHAQVFNMGGGGSSSGGINMQGIGGVIASCSVGWIAKRIAARKLQNAANAGINAGTDAAGDVLESSIGINPFQITSGGGIGPTVPVSDSATRTSVQTGTSNIENEGVMQSFKEECLDALARFAMLKLIDKLTFSIVDWVNSGFKGDSFYPKDRPNFFEQIAKDEVLSFTSWFSMNPQDYPFGKIVAETILMSLQNTVQSNFRSSLQQVLAHSNQYANYENFQAKFSVGGWAGYTAFALPNNNVFGNYLMANSHLARQTAGTNITVAANFSKELSEAGGLINQRKCAATAHNDSSYTSGDEYFDSTDPMHLGNWPVIPQGGSLTPGMVQALPSAVANYLDGLDGPGIIADGPNTIFEYNIIVKRSTCVRWMTLTPGRFIAEQTTQALGSPLRVLELGDELNENIGLIFDALLNQLVSRGLASFSNSTGSYSSNPNDPNYNALWAQMNDSNHGSSSNQPNISDVITGGTGTGSGGTSNLGLVALQQNYVVLADEVITKISDIIRDTRTLDYCVPGPNPKWYENGYENLIATIDSNVADFYGTEQEIQNYYADWVNQIAGVTVSTGPHVGSNSQFRSFMTHIFNKYSEEMFNRYALSNPPPAIRPTAANLFNQIPNHQSTITFLQGQVSGLAGVMSQLEYIQSELMAITPASEQQNQNNPQVQMLTSLLNQIASQGVLVNQDEYAQLSSQNTAYAGQLSMINQHIQSCIAQTAPAVYPVNNERTLYPFPSIQNNPNFGNIQSPSGNTFMSDTNFGSGAGSINISSYGGQNISVSSSGTATFANVLGIY